jgi:Ni2+-binding GTPase involved in maturation of urease and hydrogenase
MRAKDVMTSHPILVSAAEQDRAALRRLMEDADIHHLPIVEDGHLLGVWVATGDGRVVMLGRDRVEEISSDASADAGMRALMGDAEAVLVRDAGLPVGVITRSDVLGIVRTAIGRGIGRRHPRPTVIRIAGPSGAGKTTLIMRSLAHLGQFDAVVVQANVVAGEPGGAEAGAGAAGVREVVEPSAHWRSGLERVVSRLADSELILVEDRDGELDLAHGIGEDVQVAVIPAADAGTLSALQLADAQAVVLTAADGLAPEAVAEILAAVERRCPGLATFVVASVQDDEGLDPWVRWVSMQVMRRHG